MKPRNTIVAGLLIVLGVFLGVFGAGLVGPTLRPGEAVAGQAEPEHEGEARGEHDEHGAEGSLIRLDAQARQIAGIRVEPVERTTRIEDLIVPGVVEVSPNRRARITPPTPGKVVRILVSIGARVGAGQRLAVLDSYEVAQAHAAVEEARSEVRKSEAALITARAEVEEARVGVSIAEAETQQARTKRQSAEAALTRQRELAAAGAFSQAPLLSAQSALNEAQSELLRAQSELQTHAAALQRAERLHREDLMSRQDLEAAQLEYRQDQAAVETAKSAVAIAQQTLDREKRVAAADLLNRQAVQTAEAELRSADDDLGKAEKGVALAKLALAKAEKNERAARLALQGTEASLASARAALHAIEGGAHIEGTGGLLEVVAPFAGTITEVNVTLGEAVERSSALFVIENVRSVVVVAQVPERNASGVRVGRPVMLTVPAYPGRRFAGVIQGVGGRIEERTRTLPVRVLVDNRQGLLKPDMFAQVHVGLGSKRTSLFVPASAIETDGGRSYVYVEHEDGFERREVSTGGGSAGYVEVLSGIRDGDRVAVAGVFVLKSEGRKGELKGHEH